MKLLLKYYWRVNNTSIISDTLDDVIKPRQSRVSGDVSVAAGCSQNNSLETDEVVVDIQWDDTRQISHWVLIPQLHISVSADIKHQLVRKLWFYQIKITIQNVLFIPFPSGAQQKIYIAQEQNTSDLQKQYVDLTVLGLQLKAPQWTF